MYSAGSPSNLQAWNSSRSTAYFPHSVTVIGNVTEREGTFHD
ncbi:MAG: hypothetical protein ACJAZO_003039 [Myxococcota bacterium]|jgi:hypothetical protein